MGKGKTLTGIERWSILEIHKQISLTVSSQVIFGRSKTVIIVNSVEDSDAYIDSYKLFL